jgi:1-acyl-sn-glycerol-3-phosphate acyltransferase
LKGGRRYRVRAVLRLLDFLRITAEEICMCFWRMGLHGHSQDLSARAVQKWAARLVNRMGVRIRVRGDVPPRGVLLVANHRSYMDIAVIGGILPCSFLAKAEVARWPLVGYGARRFGNIVFVRREDATSRKEARSAVAEVLKGGISITVFPEGTTDTGPGLLPFRKGIFRMAAEGGFPVVPVAVQYDDPRDAWVGDDTFLRHFMQTFSRKKAYVTVAFGPCLEAGDPEALRQSTWDWIHRTLVPPARDSGVWRQKAA